MSPAPLLEPGDVIRDTYTVSEALGAGAYGQVYLVRHRFMGMQAMKVFLQPTIETDRGADALREAFLLSRISHPHVVRVFDANVAETRAGPREYLTMEFVDGCALDAWLDANGPVTPRRAVTLLIQVAAAAAHAHSQTPPILHRDIKPGNVLARTAPDGSVALQLGDFGLAMTLDPDADPDALGTLLYMAPEALDGRPGTASDVWSMGVMLYEMIAGVPPYPRSVFQDRVTMGEVATALRSVQDRPLQPPSHFRADIPAALDALTVRALAPDPAARFADGRAMWQALLDVRETLRGAGRDTKSDAEKLIARAYELAKQAASLPLAVEMLEEAITLDPSQRARHTKPLESWRRGVAFWS